MPVSQRAEADAAARGFYVECLRHLSASGIPFLIGGTHALNVHTAIDRPPKDLDVFTLASEYPRILAYFAERGYEAAVEDPGWLAKVRRGPFYIDVIFNASAPVAPVTESWFRNAVPAQIEGCAVAVLSPTELLWSKALVQSRDRYDGADCAHLILRQQAALDWRRLLSYMDEHWELLLMHLLNFRFVYPSETAAIPGWLLDELLSRLARDRGDLARRRRRICRGRVLSRADYLIDVTEWGFEDPLANGDDPDG